MLSLLRMRLHQAVDGQTTFAEVAAAKAGPSNQLERSSLASLVQALPIKRFHTVPFVYGCAIAHHLATPSQPATLIAAQLASAMQAHSHQLNTRLPEIAVQATATGWIQFELGDRAIAAWLDLLLDNALPAQLAIPLAATEPAVNLQASVIFDVQYAHARCCSLLRLAHREALMTLDRLDAPCDWRMTNPTSIPWLTSAGQLCLEHPADRDLLGHLVEALDCLADDSPRRMPRTLRSAQAIAQAMQTFHRVHPLWCRGVDPTLVVAQLGLLMATQRILYRLLAEGLALDPVVEL